MGTSTSRIYRPIYIFIYGLVREESANFAYFGFVFAFFLFLFCFYDLDANPPSNQRYLPPLLLCAFSFGHRSHSTSRYLRYSFVSLLSIVSVYVASVIVSTFALYS